MKICPICGKENEEDQTLCRCGFNFQGTNHIPSAPDGEVRSIKREKKRLFFSKRVKGIIIALVLAAALFAAGFTVYYNSFVHFRKSFDPVFYISEGKIMCADASNPFARSMEIDTVDKDTSLLLSLTDNLLISEDNRLLVYPNNFRYTDDGLSTVYDLYFYNFELSEEPPQKIAEGVSEHTVNASFDTLTYLKGVGTKAKLYRCSFGKEEELIAKKISSYSVSADGSCVIYENTKGNVYLSKKGEEPTLILKNATVEYISDDFSQFFCLQKGKLTRHTPDGEKALIDKGVSMSSHFSFGFRNGKGYYTKLTKSFPLSDYLTDDMASKDKASGVSEGKLIREEIRKEVLVEGARIELYSLYYFDGVKSQLVAENVSDGYVEESYGSVLCAYSSSEKQSFRRVTMSELFSAIEGTHVTSFYTYLTSPEAMNEKHYVCFEDKSLHIEKAEDISFIDSLSYAFGKNEIYFTVKEEGSENADLYKLSADSDEFQQAELIAQGIAPSVYLLPDERLVYMKENENEAEEKLCSLYLDSEIIGKEAVGCYEAGYDKKNLLFMQGYNEEDTEFSYIHINEKGVNHFSCAVNIDYGALCIFTEKNTVLLSDGDFSSGNTFFAKRNRARKANIRSSSQGNQETEKISFILPSHPGTVKNKANSDWTFLD